jgi:hypothetical protein
MFPSFGVSLRKKKGVFSLSTEKLRSWIVIAADVVRERESEKEKREKSAKRNGKEKRRRKATPILKVFR